MLLQIKDHLYFVFIMDVAQQFKTGATFLKRASIVKRSSIVFGLKLAVKRVENLLLTVERTALNYNCNMPKL